MARILIIDDDPHLLAALQRALRQWPGGQELATETFDDPFRALDRICVQEFDLVISDFMMPKLSGGELLKALKDVAPNTVRIMLSGSRDFGTALNAINEAGVFRFIPKPWQDEELQEAIGQALDYRKTLLDDAARRAEAEQALQQGEPGLLDVQRGPDGSVIL
jgi:two-component system probable response regulator PhcQ